MSLPTALSVRAVSDLFFRRIKEISVQSLKELKEGNKRPELRLIRPTNDGLPAFDGRFTFVKSATQAQSASQLPKVY